MGGNITIIIRESKEKVHKMNRWTNSMPFFFHSEKFMNKDKAHLDEYLFQWQEMMDDYKKNKKTGKFKFPMTESYAPQSGVVAPCDYGLVYIDYVKNKIYSMQGYSSVDKLYLTSISISVRQNETDTVQDVQDLVNSKRLKAKNYMQKVDPKVKALEKSKDIAEDITSIKGDDLYSSYFQVDLSPFVLTQFEESKKGVLALKKALKKDFKLSKKEEALWTRYIKDHFDDEE